MSTGDPRELPLPDRQRIARELWQRHGAIIAVLQDMQRHASLREHLGLAAQELESLARQHWPNESWESVSGSGPPRHGDWHVKVGSTLAATQEDGGVGLRIRTLRIGPEMQLGDVDTIVVPLALAESLLKALDQQVAYWHDNPPIGGR